MEHAGNKLVEMVKTDNGYTINNLCPFFIHAHVHELLDQARKGLLIYKELQTITSIENTDIILDIIRKASDVDAARNGLMERFPISELTAQHILDSPLEELIMFGTYSYESSIEIYEEAVASFEKLFKMQAVIDAQIAD